MFYDVFDSLCKEKGTSPSAVCVELGMSKTTSSYWKRTNSTPKREALEKIAAYFSVSVDYLLGRETSVGIDFGSAKTKIAPVITGESEFIEPIAIKADAKSWNEILNRLSRESKVKLFEHAKLLLLAQDQADKEDQ